MKTNYNRSLLLFCKLFFFIACKTGFSQTIPVGFSGIDNTLRQLQLEGKISDAYSMCARPLFSSSSFQMDSIYKMVDSMDMKLILKKKKLSKFSVETFPLTINSQYNSHHPYGWNNAPMIQAKGWESVITSGMYASYGIFSIQINPQLVYANNPDFEHNSSYGAATTGPYHRFFPGQSSVRMNIGNVSLGISTENIWWGPGVYNSLLMSSNAPGFLHLTFNTTHPVKTAIGNFEWQLVCGKLYEDTTVLLENKSLTTTYYNPLTYGGEGYSGPYDPSLKWRYFNGATITYQPKWVKGLFLGINRIAYAYNDNLSNGGAGFLKSYLPIFFGVFRQNYAYGLNLPTSAIRYKQMVSLHGRYLFQKSNTEIYGEYGWGDNQYNLRDFVLSVSHSSAYIVGIKKMVALASKRWLDFHYEVTHMTQPLSYLVRSAGNWYGYQGGYTNNSRIIGAGVGYGNNVQTFTVTHINGWKELGLRFERLEHDPINHATDWTDISVGIILQRRYNHVLINMQSQFVKSGNYLWEDGKNRFNLFSSINFSYRFL